MVEDAFSASDFTNADHKGRAKAWKAGSRKSAESADIAFATTAAAALIAGGDRAAEVLAYLRGPSPSAGVEEGVFPLR